jgi:epimerase transport system membrane fusion protein
VSCNVLNWTWLSLAIGLAALAAWAALAPVSGAVVAEGVVKADGNRKTVQHQEGGIVKQILVRDGDRVHAGQVLLTLVDVRTDAGLDNLQTQVQALQAREARLSAERDLANSPDFGSLQLSGVGRRGTDLVHREFALFTARRTALDTQLNLLRREASEVQQEIRGLTSLTRTTMESQAIAEAETRMNQLLQEKGFISEARLMEMRRNHTDYRARHETQLTELARATQKKTELELKTATLRNEYVKGATDDLKEAANQLYKLEEEIRPLRDAQTREAILAPVAGEIVDLKFHSIGAVIGPREPVLDIAPLPSELLVEAHVKPEYIKDIHDGSHADVRLTAYKQRTTPVVEGHVVYVGADRLTDKVTNQPYYLAHIRIEKSALEKASALAGRAVELGQGMQAEVFIKTEERTAFDYLMEPIASGLRRGMRER